MDHVSNSTSGKECLNCGYGLDDPAGDRCPRCGYCLDPAPSQTLPSGHPGPRSIVSGVPYWLAACFGLLLLAAPFLYVGCGGEGGGSGPLIGIPQGYFCLALVAPLVGVLLEAGVLLRLRAARSEGRRLRSAKAAKMLAQGVIIVGFIPGCLSVLYVLLALGVLVEIVGLGLLIFLVLGLILVVIGVCGHCVGSDPCFRRI